MHLESLSRWLGKPRRQRPHSGASALPGKPRRPTLEKLEDRLAPATLLFQNFDGVAPPNLPPATPTLGPWSSSATGAAAPWTTSNAGLSPPASPPPSLPNLAKAANAASSG